VLRRAEVAQPTQGWHREVAGLWRQEDMSMSNPFQVWTVHRNNIDRGDGPPTDICATQALANQVAKKSGWHGGDAPVKGRWAATVDGSTYLIDGGPDDRIIVASGMAEIDMAREEKLKREALAKLTPAERCALGLG
jgi:hypothetical protein